MKKWIKTGSIATKLTFAYAFFIIIPFLVFSIYNYIQTLNEVNLNAEESRNYIVGQLKTGIDHKRAGIEDIANDIISNDTMTTFLAAPYSPFSSTQLYRDEVLPIIKSQMDLSASHISRIFIIMKNETIPEGFDIFFSEKTVRDTDMYRQFIDTGEEGKWFFNSRELPSIIDSEVQFHTITYVKKIDSPFNKTLGSIVIEVEQDYLFADVSDFHLQDAAVKITTAENRELLSENTQILRKKTVFGREKETRPVTIEQPLEGLGASMTLYFSLEANRYLLNNSLFYSGILIVLLMVGAAIFYLFLKNTFQRINENVKTIDHVVSNNVDTRLEVKGSDEFSQISKNFNILLDKIQALLKEGIKKETAQKDAQLKALLMQIKPHFIYNTIDMFSAKMELCGQYEVADYLSDFARMIRYTTRSTSIQTTLTAELEYTDHYINLQRCKYNDRISMKLVARQDLTPYRTIRFILQPLVENSILHGFDSAGLQNTFSITIKIKVIRDIIYIVLSDDGVGMEPGTVGQINREFISQSMSIDNERSFSNRGIGMHNINNRLKLFYGDEYHLVVRSRQGRFTKTYLRIPVEKEDYNHV